MPGVLKSLKIRTRIPQKKNIAVFSLFAKSLKSLKIRPQAFSPFTHLYVLRRTLVTKAEMYCGKDRAA